MVDGFKADGMKYAEGLAEALIGKLGLVLMQEFQLLSRLRGEVVLLRDDAALMNALLRMFSEADEGAVDHFVREWMKQVRELAYDGEDCMDIFFKRISWLPRSAHPALAFFQQTLTLFPRRSLASEISALRARAIAISERRARYGVYGQALQPSEAFGARVPMSSTPPVLGGANDDPSQFVGMAAQIESLSDMLKLPRGNDDKFIALTTDNKKLQVCSIVGMGGVGKTTLALRVFRSFQHTEFQFRAVVSVSQNFDLHGLMKGIYEAFRFKGSTADEFERHLADKRYLILLDDVWTESSWDAISAKLPENNMGSRIIVTTRIANVAARCVGNGGYIHQANLLKDEQSKALFVGRVFGQPIPDAAAAAQPQPIVDAAAAAPNDGCPEELKEKMDIILKKCGGLPLTIVCIANVLARYNSTTSIEMWTRVCNSIGSQLETNSALEGMMQIVALSYNHLPHPLKACMMLLGIFPRGYHIPKWRVLRRWISEGLIPEKRGMTLLDVAGAYYDELLSRNMIQLVVLSNGNVSVGHCCMHDVMHEVIVSKSLDANFVSLVGSPRGGTSNDPVRRLCIHGDVGYVADGRSMQHVRSLTMFGDKTNVGVGKLLDALGKFTLLRVLDLEDCKDVTNKHMKQVCRLFLLRYLNLNETDITKLPNQISKLEHLQVLMLYDACLKAKDVPKSVFNIKKLEFLSYRNRDDKDTLLEVPQRPRLVAEGAIKIIPA